MKWDPSRFISTKLSDSIVPTQIFENEVIAPDTFGHFIPFAWGQRVCPGKKFAQVELVAALAVFFRDWRVESQREKEETDVQARERAWRKSLVVDHEGHMLHEMVDPEGVGLRWVKKGVRSEE